MTQWTQTITATGTTTTFDLQPPIPAGQQWIVPMLSVEVLPFQSGITCTITSNGRLLTNTFLGSADTAYGPPPKLLNPGDLLTITWVGTSAGDACTITLYYDEQPWTTSPNANVVV
jgi:hypothetical protein